MVGFGLLDGWRGLPAVKSVEAAGDLAGELDVSDLILSNGNEVGLIEEDVGGLEERIAEEAVGVEVLLAELLLLVFVGGDALEPRQRREHAEEGVQLGVLRDVRLDEDGADLGVETGGEEVDRHVADVLAERGGIGVVGGEGVEVGDEEVALVLVLELDPVVERAHVVAEVKAAGGTHAREDAGA